MQHTTLIVPGLNDSGPGHWQSWMESQLPDARRVRQIDWGEPVLAGLKSKLVYAPEGTDGG